MSFEVSFLPQPHKDLFCAEWWTDFKSSGMTKGLALACQISLNLILAFIFERRSFVVRFAVVQWTFYSLTTEATVLLMNWVYRFSLFCIFSQVFWQLEFHDLNTCLTDEHNAILDNRILSNINPSLPTCHSWMDNRLWQC